MLKPGRFILGLSIFYILLSACKTTIQYEEADQEIYRKADSILASMTLEEKVGQMLNVGLPALLEGPFYSTRDTLRFDTAKVNRILVKYGAGSVQNLGNYPLTPEEWRHYIGAVQDIAINKTRLKIPLLYGIDAAHGANYTAGSVMFPHQINVAASFNRELAKGAAQVTAYELKACAIPWNYSPVLDVARNPLWGRIYETFGEDIFLTSEMGQAMIDGMQGDNPAGQEHVVACAKHFLGYGASYNGKDRSPVIMPERMIREILLPPFEKAIDNGLLSIMVASGTLNGTPSHTDKWLLTDLLKDELGFKGVVITDWNDLDNLVSVHKVAKDEREAVKMSVLAGIDMCMEPYDESFAVHLIDLVKTGEVPESRINDAVRRILYLKYKSGVFTDPLFEKQKYPGFSKQESHEMNYQAAGESIVLLKNEADILPLQTGKKILVTGVAANSLNYLNGGWSRTWAGQDPQYNDKDKLTILDAIQKNAGKNNVLFSQGTDYTKETDIQETVNKAQKCDVIITCVGEIPATEKPSDIEELDLPEAQQNLVKALAETGKPIILVMVQGRPRIIREIEGKVQAAIMAFLPGNEGGRAIADILFGKINPSGKLPYTWPRYSGSLWTYDHQLSDERDVNFGLNGFTPQYEFGTGLSYTTFEYGIPKLSADTISISDTLQIWVKLRNTGNMKGKEAVLLYVSDEIASISPPVKRLRGFQKPELNSGESVDLSFQLSGRDFMFVNNINKWTFEPGYITIQAGDKTARVFLK
ncbi:MAG: glycoside hydrolase family 3 C-terminal domain-containing protein [Bacteroidales bacterium]|nr:glycoside hydrolase family 3 C-terminal domain-containing protein [Bacteroidales bacterium]MBN2820989.1 glycoside hydrolase family 3 C-terminal domain-containing protein [Bacteroidales bacterium]